MLTKFKNTPSCEGTDTELWFSNGAEYANEVQLRKTCARCPARQECLEYALHHNVLGFWAGTNHGERNKLRKQLGIVPEPVNFTEWLRDA